TTVVRCPPQLQPTAAAAGVVLMVGTDPSGSGLFILAADKSLYSDGMIWHGSNSILAINTVRLLATGRRFFAVVETGQLSSADTPPSPSARPDRDSQTPPPLFPDLLRNPPPPIIQPPPIPPAATPPPADLPTMLRTANALLDKLQQSDLLNRTLRDRPRSVRPGSWLRTMLLLVCIIAGLWILLLLVRRRLPSLPEWKSRLLQSVYGVQTARQIQQEEFGAAAEVLCRRFCVEVTGSPLETDWLRLRAARQQTPALATLPAPLKSGLEDIVGIAIHGSRISLPEKRFRQLGTQLRDLLLLHRRSPLVPAAAVPVFASALAPAASASATGPGS
ncbi:MAG: hypothetical protein RLZZ436_915, partial [Planctomycetota bacterium]